jgi:prevent-host-death family protein
MEMDVADCLRAAEQGDTVLVTRNGEPVVALVSALKLELVGKKEAPPEGLAGLAGGWEGSEELVERTTGNAT